MTDKDRETVVVSNSGGGGNGAWFVAILVVIVAVVIGYVLYTGGTFGGGDSVSVEINEAPAPAPDAAPAQ
jgi:hypothetical protein